jgi:butyrate kinase
MGPTVLAVNPGSTSTKMALSGEGGGMQTSVLRHDAALLQEYPRVWDQFPSRLEALRTWMREAGGRTDAVISLGGLLKPLQGGTYRVSEAMLADARANLQGEHASNLGCALAEALAREFGGLAMVADPVSVDEFEPLARYSGHPLVIRKALAHSLNLHATARRAARDLRLDPARASFVVAHLGGGISVAPIRGGRIIDINDASSDGPFSPERTGGLPLQQFVTLCFSGRHTEAEIRKLVMGRGGLVAYLGTSSAPEVEGRIERGDAEARLVYEAMAYQIAKEIGAMATVLSGALQAVVLTGGLAASGLLTGWIRERVGHLGPVLIYPGEDELGALVEAARGVLAGESTLLEY